MRKRPSSRRDGMPSETDVGTMGPDFYFCLRGRAGKETDKRNLTLVDDTCTEIILTLWGASAKDDERRWEGNPVVAFKGVKVTWPCTPLDIDQMDRRYDDWWTDDIIV